MSISLPLDLIPQKVVITKLPNHLVGRMRADNPLSLDTLQLTGSPLPLAVDLVFNNLPYYNAVYSKPNPLVSQAVCGFKLRGFDSVWAFYDLVSSGNTRFIISPAHHLWVMLGLPALASNRSRYWRITSLKESGDLRDVKTVTLSIVECGLQGSTLLTVVAIPSAQGRALNPFVIQTLAANAGNNPYMSSAAKASSGRNSFKANPARIGASIPAYWLVARILAVPVQVLITAVRTSSFNTPTARPGVRRGLTSIGMSNDYEYTYQRAKAFIIQN